MTASRTSLLVSVVLALVLGTVLAPSEAHAQAGSWSWGTPGFTDGWSSQDRTNALATQGLADPNVNYWTPFWGGYDGANYYTGDVNTGLQNTFAVNHDINANFGIPLLGYLDIFTPLFGTNELAIASTVASVWSSIVDTVSSVWSSISSVFSSDYSSYESTGTYNTDYGNSSDNAFDGGYSDYGGWGGDGGGGDGGGGGGGGRYPIAEY